jgi:PAS domain S-box-containing protein
MHFQYIPYIWLLVVSAAVATGFGAYAWRRRSVPGATPFVAICLTAVVWAVSNALEMSGTDLPTKLFWANVQYLVYAALPVAWLALALDYTGRGAWLAPRRLAVLAAEPAITVVLAWTSQFHGLIRQNVILDSSGSFPVIGKTYGPWFWIHVGYSYVLFAISIYLLLVALRRAPSLYRRQALTVLIGFCLPLIWNVLYTLGLSPVPRHDLAPAVLGLSGVVVGAGLFRLRLFDIGPIARDTVIDHMDDGMVVLDAQNRIVDLNAAAEKPLGVTASQAVGRLAEELFSPWPGLVELYRNPAVTNIELPFDIGNEPRWYDVHISLLADRHGQPRGQVIVWRDITDRKQAEDQLLRQQRVLAGLEERERLARGLHDNLAQVLGYATVQAQAVRELLAKGQTDVADTHLARLVDATREAHADAREYILGVKTGISSEQGFPAALGQYLQRFGQTCGLDTELIVPESEALAEASLEPTVEIQLVRIVQEALTNVRKHAGATSVRVSLAIGDGRVQVMVEDDGRGFDPARLPADDAQNFGLDIMRERAEEVEGSLEVLSAPGQGTRITVRAPLSIRKDRR